MTEIPPLRRRTFLGLAAGDPGIAGHEPVRAESQAQFTGVMTASEFVHEATPGGGSYSNEGNYFQDNWQTEFWGSNYPRLLRVKKQYDPTNLFRVHKGVGSEDD
ncbi:MAG: BBE domain-containing protein [Candidatus Nanopelagicales bacterium]|jgi:FAD/FMN-containing dehydrogenase|nr:BBE domain-containing protein [Candidatus Nanopelagicales bacterium]MDP4715261.1 BBE domain-containing protein [Candidatus Nanopelagicales bacterium]MDP4906265.1 BBE domain-containing protein [Candidatus Nanopelagicales bacterium]MDP4974150.1 BBE domain-containing protein [Candidatus Nanopelagicales bacterium]